MTSSREPEDKKFKGFNGTIYVVAILIGTLTGLISILAQIGLFSKLSPTPIAISQENPTLESPKTSSDSSRSQPNNTLPKRANLNTVKVGDLTATLQGCQDNDKSLESPYF